MKNKLHISVVIFILLFAGAGILASESEKKETPVSNRMVVPEFHSIINSANVDGAVLIYDPKKGIYYSNNFTWANVGKLPASTFKIPNSMIALEIGIVDNNSTLLKWDGKKRYLKIWEKDLHFQEAFRLSCVPCYQKIAKKIGEKRMNEYLTQFDYGDMRVDSTNVDVFWLKGDSRITQFQQIDFLKRFYRSELPISERTEKIMKRMIILEDNKNYSLSGKTGWSIRGGNNNGWFVGYVEKKNKVYFFATNVEPKENFNMKMFSKIREKITRQALKQLKIIK